jgi:putative peptidoglycan lipid II flippase
MKSSFLKAESTNKAIVSSMALSMFAKVFNFAQSLVASYAFGTQASTDILFYMLSMVILLSTLLSAVNQQVIVPNVIFIRTSNSEEDSKKFISFIYFVYLAIGATVTMILMLMPEKILALFSKFSMEHIMSNIDILKFIIPTFILIIANTFILDIFTSYRYFTLPMLLDMLKNIIIILFVLLFKDVFSVTSLAMGVLVGNLAQFLLLNFLLFSILKCKPSFRAYHLSNEIKGNIGYVTGGFLTTFLSSFVVMYLMSGFSSGVFSAMDYGQKISTVFIMVIVGQITTVVGMNIIELHAKNDLKKLNETFINYLKMSIFLIIPFSFIISINSDGIISILFERGKFTKDSVALTSVFLKYLILTLPYALINSFMVRLIIAKQIQRVSFWWQTSQSIGNILILWPMIYFFGYVGYPIGGLIADYIYIFLLLYFLIKNQFNYIDNKQIIRFFFTNGLLNFGIAAVFYFFIKADADGSFIQKLVHVSWVSAAFILMNLVIGYGSGINRNEITKMIKWVVRA